MAVLIKLWLSDGSYNSANFPLVDFGRLEALDETRTGLRRLGGGIQYVLFVST